MAYSVSNIGAPLGTVVAQDTALNGTGDMNVRGGATNMYFLDVDNSLNAAVTYIQLFNASAATVGTTQADWCFYVPASTRLPIPFPQGVAFPVGFCMAATTTPHGSSNPASNVTVRVTLS